MLYLKDGPRPFCMIRLPRTANTAMTEALADMFQNVVRDNRHLKHVTARYLRRQLGESTWNGLYRFAFTRDPREVVCSFFRHTREAYKRAAVVNFQGLRCTASWVEEMKRVAEYVDVNEYVEAEFLSDRRLPPGGWWRKFCEGPDGEDLGVVPYRFADLPGSWEALCSELGISDPPELPVVNDAVGGGEWQGVLRDDVAARLFDKCTADRAVGGYE